MAKSEYKYPENIVELVEAYIAECGNEQMRLPTVEELALRLNVNDDTLNDWSKKHEDFAKVFNRLKMYQKVQLINGGMYGGKEINASMFIFLLKANHNMIESDRHIIETKGSLIDVEDDGKTEIHTVSPVPAKTN